MKPFTRIRCRRRQEANSPLFIEELREQQKEIHRTSRSPNRLHSRIVGPPDEGKCRSIRTVQTATCQKKSNRDKKVRASCCSPMYSESGSQSSTRIKRKLPSARCRLATPDAYSSRYASSSASGSYASTSVLSTVTSDPRVVDSAASFKSLVECPISDSWHDFDSMNQCRVCPQTQTRKIPEVIEWGDARQIDDNEWIIDPYPMSLSDDEGTNASAVFRRKNRQQLEKLRKTCDDSSCALSNFDATSHSEHHTDELDGDSGANSERSAHVSSLRSTGGRYWYDDDAEVTLSCCQRHVDRSFDADDVLPPNGDDVRWTPSKESTCKLVHRLYDNRFALNAWKKRDDNSPYIQYNGRNTRSFDINPHLSGVFDNTSYSYLNPDPYDCASNEVKHCEKTCVKTSMRARKFDKTEEFGAKFQSSLMSELLTGTTTQRTMKDTLTKSEEEDRSSMDSNEAFFSDSQEGSEESPMEEESARSSIDDIPAGYAPRGCRRRSRVEAGEDEMETEETSITSSKESCTLSSCDSDTTAEQFQEEAPDLQTTNYEAVFKHPSGFDDPQLSTILQSPAPYASNIAQSTELAPSSALQSTASTALNGNYLETSLVAPLSTATNLLPAKDARSLSSQPQDYSSFSSHEDIMLLSRSLSIVSENISPDDLELQVPSTSTVMEGSVFDISQESSALIPDSLKAASETEPKELHLEPPSSEIQQQLKRLSDRNASQIGLRELRELSRGKLHLENAGFQARRVQSLPSLVGYHHTDGYRTLTAIPENESWSLENVSGIANASKKHASDSELLSLNYGTISPLTPDQRWAVLANQNAQGSLASNRVVTVRVSFDEALPVQQMQTPTDELQSGVAPASRELMSEERSNVTHLGAVGRTQPSPSSDADQRLSPDRQSTVDKLQQTRIPRLQTNDTKVIPRMAVSSIEASQVSSQTPSEGTVVNLQVPSTPKLLLQIQVLPQVTSYVADKPASQTSNGGSSSQVSKAPLPTTTSGTYTAPTLMELLPDSPKASKDPTNELQEPSSPKDTVAPKSNLKQSDSPANIKDAKNDLNQKSFGTKQPYSTYLDNNGKISASEPTLEIAKDSPTKDAEDKNSAKRARSAVDRLVESKTSESVASSPKKEGTDDNSVERSSLQMSKIPVPIRSRDEIIRTSPIHITTNATQTSSNLLQQPESLQAKKDAKDDLLHPGLPKAAEDSQPDLQQSESPKSTKKDRKDVQILPQDITDKLGSRSSIGSSSSQMSKIPVQIKTSGKQPSLTLLQMHPVSPTSAQDTKRVLQKPVSSTSAQDTKRVLQKPVSPTSAQDTKRVLQKPVSPTSTQDTKRVLQKPVSPKASGVISKDLQQIGSPKTTKGIKETLQQTGSAKVVIDPKKALEQSDSPKSTKGAQKDLQPSGSDVKKVMQQPALPKTTKDVKIDLKQKSSGTERPYGTYYDNIGKKAVSEITLKTAKSSATDRAEDKSYARGAKSTLGLLFESDTSKSVTLDKTKYLEKDKRQPSPASGVTDLKRTPSSVDDKKKKVKSEKVKGQPRAPSKSIRRNLKQKSGIKAKLRDETKLKRKLREPAAKNPSLPEALRRSEGQVLHNPLALAGDEVLDELDDGSEESMPQWEIVSSDYDGSLVSILKKDGKSRKKFGKRSSHLTFSEDVEILFIDDDEYMDVVNWEDKEYESETEDEN